MVLRQEDVEFENNLGYKLNSRPASVSNIIRLYYNKETNKSTLSLR